MLTSTTTHEGAGAHGKDEAKADSASLLQHLTTESQNEASQGFDTKSALEIARIINHEDAKVAAAVKKALGEVAEVIDHVARSLRDGGRLIYIGAGSSGRIAALDASECPPTYSTAPGQVQYIMAGGPKALVSVVEVNEDFSQNNLLTDYYWLIKVKKCFVTKQIRIHHCLNYKNLTNNWN